MVYSRKELEAIAKVVVKKDIYVVADEMYENLVYDDQEHVSIASLGKEIYEHTITCSGLSKAYAMTGWRIGYTASSVEIAKLMSAIQSHATSNPNSIAQYASVEALNGPQGTIEKMRQEFDKRRLYMYERVKLMPYVDILKPQGAFYLFIDISEALKHKFKGAKIADAKEFASKLLEERAVAVIPCGDFGFPNHVRLSYAISMEQITKGLNRIEEFLRELK